MKIKVMLHKLLLLFISIIIIGSIYYKLNFSGQSFGEIYFYAINGVTHSDSNVFIEAIKVCGIWLIILFFIIIQLYYPLPILKNLFIIKYIKKHKNITTIILLIITIIILLFSINVFGYIKSNTLNSSFIEDNYINPKKVKIDFKTKKNLIFITVESLETTFFSKEQGGEWEYNIIPELYDLLNKTNSITFSPNKFNGGMSQIDGSDWTTASLFANSSGLPFIVPIEQNNYKSNNFMNGAYTLGDLLKDNGYYNELISSATTSFGGIKELYTKHGNYNIIDVDSLDKELKEEEKSTWGFNDKYMFNLAKERLLEISQKEQPFNLQLVTIDTHFPNGIVEDYTVNEYKKQYENVYRTDSILISDFIQWIREQDFYENTTIVIVGDHLNMQNNFFKTINKYNRYIYNVIINSSITTNNTKNRIFTALDTYPTVVSAMGGIIEDNKLGLGVNLFSKEVTLAEKNSINYLNKEIQKKSLFYNNYILGKDYYEIIKKKK